MDDLSTSGAWHKDKVNQQVDSFWHIQVALSHLIFARSSLESYVPAHTWKHGSDFFVNN